MKSRVLAVVAFLLGAMAPTAVWAKVVVESDAETLTKGLYCGIKSLIEGQVGILLGLVFVAAGLFSLIRGGKWVPALILVGTGALITAVPTLINSFFTGYSEMLNNAGIASGDSKSFSSLGSSCSSSLLSNTADSGASSGFSNDTSGGLTQGSFSGSAGSNYTTVSVKPDPGTASGAIFYGN